MKLHAHIKESLINLLSAKLRSFLAILGVLVGTASVVALITGGILATDHALSQFKELGTDILAITFHDTSRLKSGQSQEQVDLEHIQALANNTPGIINVAPYALEFATINYQGKYLQGNIIGADNELFSILKLKLSEGREISHLDDKAHFAVLGSNIAGEASANSGLNVIGTQILVGKQYFTVAGKLNSSTDNMFFVVDINHSIIVPLKTALTLSKYVMLTNVVFKLKKDADIEEVKNNLTEQFNRFYPNKKIFFRSPQEIIKSMKKQNETFTLLLGFIGSIALIVGGIGVMNIMLVSVVERRREIGIRMAVGATRNDIQIMFLTEAISLTLFGGLFGVLLGELVAFVTAHFSGWGFHMHLFPAMVGFIVSAMVGIFFGFYPARKAAQLDPIETLRSE